MNSDQALVDYRLSRIIGLRVWKPSVDFGSFLTIELGEPRIDSLGKMHGEFYLWIYGASWQIRDSTRLVACSSDERVAMLEGARLLDATTVSAARFDRNQMTLDLRFDTDIELSAMPLGDPEMEEWMLYLKDGNVLSAGPGKAVTYEWERASHPLPTKQEDGVNTDDP
jgi:hypothetical protein